MSMLMPQSGDIPRPVPSVWSKQFWAGCARGELLFQRCNACGGVTHKPAAVCAHCCAPEMAWEISAGNGTVYSWTTVWRPQSPAFESPYVAIIVELDEGWMMLSNLVGCDHDAVHIGMRVRVRFHELDPGTTLPYFEPALPDQ